MTSNSMLAEKWTGETDYYSEEETLAQQQSTQSVNSPKAAVKPKQKSWPKYEVFVITLLVTCFSVLALLVFTYLAVFARLEIQKSQMSVLDQKIAAATAKHDALVESIANLTSSQQVSQAAAGLQMSVGGGNCEYVYLGSTQREQQREVASAF